MALDEVLAERTALVAALLLAYGEERGLDDSGGLHPEVRAMLGADLAWAAAQWADRLDSGLVTAADGPIADGLTRLCRLDQLIRRREAERD